MNQHKKNEYGSKIVGSFITLLLFVVNFFFQVIKWLELTQ